jgi:hypothetical protein
MPTGQGSRSFLTSDNSNREVNPVNASTPTSFEMKKLVQEPATADNTSDKELKAVHAELNTVSVQLQKVDQKIAQVEDSIKPSSRRCRWCFSANLESL